MSGALFAMACVSGQAGVLQDAEISKLAAETALL